MKEYQFSSEVLDAYAAKRRHDRLVATIRILVECAVACGLAYIIAGALT